MLHKSCDSVHDDVIKWKHFLHNWPFVRRIHLSLVNSPHKGQWRGALMFSLICIWINDWVNNSEAGDLRCYCAHYDVIVMRLWCNIRWEFLCFVFSLSMAKSFRLNRLLQHLHKWVISLFCWSNYTSLGLWVNSQLSKMTNSSPHQWLTFWLM